MNIIIPPRLQQTNIAIVRKQQYNPPSLLIQDRPRLQNHQLSPANKIVFHSPPSQPLNNYLNHLIPNNNFSQPSYAAHHQGAAPMGNRQNGGRIQSVLLKDGRNLMNGSILYGPQAKNLFKMVHIGNVSSAATRSKGISEISLSKSLQNRSLFAQSPYNQYKRPQNPLQIFKDVPVRRISRQQITLSEESRSNRSNSQSIHITIESKEANPLPSLITVTQKTPIYHPPSKILIPTQETLYSQQKSPSKQLITFNNMASANLNQTSMRTFYPQPYSQRNNFQAVVQPTNKEAALFNLNKSNDFSQKHGRNENQPQNKHLQTKSTLIDKLNLQINKKNSTHHNKSLNKAHQGRQKVFSSSTRLQQFKQSNKNYKECLQQQYNHQYYNIQLPNESSEHSLSGNSQNKSNSGFYYKHKLYQHSKTLINEIFQNETNKALLKMSKLQMRSREKSRSLRSEREKSRAFRKCG